MKRVKRSKQDEADYREYLSDLKGEAMSSLERLRDLLVDEETETPGSANLVIDEVEDALAEVRRIGV